MERKLFVRLFLPMVFPTLVFAMDMGEMKKQLEEMGALPFSSNPFFAKSVANSGKTSQTLYYITQCAGAIFNLDQKFRSQNCLF